MASVSSPCNSRAATCRSRRVSRSPPTLAIACATTALTVALSGRAALSASGETDLVTLLVSCGLASSKRIARELLAAGAISLNGAIRQDDRLSAEDRLFGRYLLLRRGKKLYHLVEWQ